MKIAFVLYPQVLATAVSVPVEMFYAASQLKSKKRAEMLEISYVGLTKGPIKVAGGLPLIVDTDLTDECNADWIFIPPMWGTPWKVIQRSVEIQKWIALKYHQGAKIIGTGTGVGHLAELGLLDNRVATTHWYYLAKFSKRYKDINFQKQHFITHQDGLYCAGSINAQTDLVLYFIERNFGEDSLALVEQQFMHELKRNFATPFYEPGSVIHEDELVSLAQSWIRNHLNETISSSMIADVVGQSERQFRRRFTQATGESPISYIQRIRIEEAQSLLRESNLTVTDIGEATGFSSSAYFSKIFKKQLSMTPIAYRNMVRKKLFSP